MTEPNQQLRPGATPARRIWALGAAVTPFLALLIMAVLTVLLLRRVVGQPPALPAATTVMGVGDSSTAGSRAPVPPAASTPTSPVVDSSKAASRAPSGERRTRTVFSETTGRLTWSISILFAVLTIGATFVAALVVIGVGHSQHPRRRISWGLLLLGIPVCFWLSYGPGTWNLNEKLLKLVYDGTDAEFFVSGVEALAYSTLLALAIATGNVLFRAGRFRAARSSPVATAAAILARRQREVRLLLYTGAAALVAGTLEVSALYSWAAGLAGPENVYFVDADVIPQTMGLLTGSFYSLLLAAIFIPVFGVLRRHAERLADLAKPGEPAAGRTKWLTENAIEASIPKQIVSLIAVLAPLIAGGPLTHVLDLLNN